MQPKFGRPHRVEPTFEIPLIRSELEDLGRCAVIFGQIDALLTMIISHLVYVDTMAGLTMMEDLTTGRKLGILRKNLFRVDNPTAYDLLKRFDQEFSGLLERRNHMFHGIWGWRIKNGSGRPACYYAGKGSDGKKKSLDNKTLYPKKIRRYADLMAEQSHRVRRAFEIIVDAPAPVAENTTTRYHFADEEEMKKLPVRGIQTAPLGRSYRDHLDPAKNQSTPPHPDKELPE